jgi:purine-binding chemotaxis protein CheW
MDYATFYVGDDLFGIPILLVQEISRLVDVFPVPGHDPRIAGLVNLRGNTNGVLDMRRCLFKNGCPESPRRRRKLIILEPNGAIPEEYRGMGIATFRESVSLLVDDVHKIVALDEKDFHPPPAHIHDSFIDGVIRNGDQLVTMLSISRLIETILTETDTTP